MEQYPLLTATGTLRSERERADYVRATLIDGVPGAEGTSCQLRFGSDALTCVAKRLRSAS